MAEALKILIIGPAWVGDMVMAQSLFIKLKQLYFNCQIDVLAPAWTSELLARMPEVSNVLEMPFKRGEFGLLKRIRFGRQLSSVGYHQAILLPNTWKSALIPFFAKISLRTGYIGECRWGLLNDARHLDRQKLKMTVLRFVALAEPRATFKAQLEQTTHFPYPKLHVTLAQQARVVEKFNISQQAKIVALCPGAEYGPAKQWPAQYYAEVAGNFIQQGKQVWLFGSPKDQVISAEINSQSRMQCLDLTGRTSLQEAIDLMSLVDAVVSNDSGLMHVAAALDKPLIALYGSSDPGFTPPLHDKAKILSLKLACSPCFKRVCPFGHTHCLSQLMPTQVLNLLRSI